MELKEVISLFGSNIRQYLSDIFVFLVAPRRYLHKVVDDAPVDLLGRLAFYALSFTVFQSAVLSVFSSKSPPSHVELLGIALAELATPLFVVPHFYIVSRFGKVEKPLKYSIAYIATYKPVLMSVTVVALALFLLSENYVIAVLKGVLFWLYLLGFFVLFPLLVGKTVRSRFALTLLSVAMIVGIFLAVSPFEKWIPKSSVNPMQYSALYDPIGIEYDSVLRVWFAADIDDNYGTPLRAFLRLLDAARAKRDAGGESTSFSNKLVELDCAIEKAEASYVAAIDSITSTASRLQYRTPRDYTSTCLEEIRAGQAGLAELRTFLKNPASTNVDKIAETQAAYYAARDLRMELGIGNMRFRRFLRQCGLVYDWK